MVCERGVGWVLSCAAAAAVALPASGGVEFLGSTYIDGKGSDLSGLTGTLEDGSPANVLDGFGSGIAYTGYANRYLLLSDRGPSLNSYPGSGTFNKTLSFASRFQIFDLPVTPAAGGGYSVGATLVGTRLLKDEDGRQFTGRSNAFAGSDPSLNLRLRPEGIRVGPDGSVYVSDEYGPSVYRFSPDGRRLATFAVPEKFRVAFPSSNTATEQAINASGRVPGKAMEGLAITPDGRYLLAAMQAPLIQDGGDGTRYTRMVLFDTADPAARPREFLYKLEADPRFPGVNVSATGVSDVVAINDHQFLVDERDASANVSKRAFVIDIDGAQDIGGIASFNALTPGQVNAIVPVSKAAAPLFDLIETTGGLPGDLPFGYFTGFPDKVEGFAFGPDLPDGRRLLLVTNDDDFAPSSGNFGYPNYVMAFAVDPADLPGFAAQQFTAPETFAPEPGGALAAAAGLAALACRRRGRDN